MKINSEDRILIRHFISFILGLSLSCLCGIVLLGFCGCDAGVGVAEGEKDLFTQVNLGTTIGSLVEVVGAGPIEVEGYGLVGGLNGTGSVECPVEIRRYLRKYILQNVVGSIDPDEMIDSHDTAVVQLEGFIPQAISGVERFDVRVLALPNTQTRSLEGGWLYTSDLKERGGFDIRLEVLGEASGPVFINKLGDSKLNPRVGYVLGGGKVSGDSSITLVIRRPSYQVSSRIALRLTERFGEGVADAMSQGRLKLTVPGRYERQRRRFVDIVLSTYLAEEPGIVSERVLRLVKELAVGTNKYESEAGLEAIGKASLPKLSVLLNSSNEEVRFRAARCIQNIGGEEGIEVLEEMAFDDDFKFRVAAIETIGAAGREDRSTSISRRLLREKDIDVRVAAYKNLIKLDDITVARDIVGGTFFVDEVYRSNRRTIYVSRRKVPRVVLFGAPMYCEGDIFVELGGGDIVINAPKGQEYVTVMRRHPRRPDIGPIKLRSTYRVGDIISRLCEDPEKEDDDDIVGLGVHYSDLILVLKRLVDSGAVDAEFEAGPLPEMKR